MSAKRFSTNKNGKAHPLHEKRGINESNFHVGDEIYPSRIPVGQKNAKRWNLQKLIALDATPRNISRELDDEIKERLK